MRELLALATVARLDFWPEEVVERRIYLTWLASRDPWFMLRTIPGTVRGVGGSVVPSSLLANPVDHVIAPRRQLESLFATLLPKDAQVEVEMPDGRRFLMPRKRPQGRPVLLAGLNAREAGGGRTPRTRSARAGRLWTPHRRVVVREQRRRRVAPGPWGTPPRKIRGLRPRLAGDRRPTASGRRSSSGRRLLSRAALDRGSGSRGNPSAVGSLRHDQAARARAGDQRSHHPLPRSARRSSARSSRRPAPKLASGSPVATDTCGERYASRA